MSGDLWLLVGSLLCLLAAVGLAGFGAGVGWAQRREARRLARITGALQRRHGELWDFVRAPGEPFGQVLRRHAREARQREIKEGRR